MAGNANLYTILESGFAGRPKSVAFTFADSSRVTCGELAAQVAQMANAFCKHAASRSATG